MSNLINEEINRIQELMYGPINEIRLSINQKIANKVDDALSKAKVSDDSVRIKIDDLKNTRGKSKITKINQYKRELEAEIIELGNKKKIAKEDFKAGKISNKDKIDLIKGYDELIANKNEGIAQLNSSISFIEGSLEKAAKRRLNAKQTSTATPAPQSPTAKKPRTPRTKKDPTKKPAAAKPDSPEQPKVTPEQTVTPTLAGEVVHPPMNQPNRFAKWLKEGMAAKIAKYVVLFGAGAIGIGYLIKWLLGSSNKSEQCMGKLLETRPNNVKLRPPSQRKNAVYYLVIPDNTAIFSIAKKIILEDRNGKFKAFNAETSQEIGSWKFGSNCTLYLVYGTQNIPMFTSTASTPTPSPAPSPGQGRYRRCSGTYKKGCVSPKIGQLQACLRITPDQKWWDKTEQAVVAKFRKNVLTDAEIDQFCRSQSTPQPAPQLVTPPQPQQPTEVPQTEEF